jgi:ABC-type Zn2+ transport system substrate-binding protein/surface adhesin
VGEDGGLHGLRGYEALPDWVEAGKEPDPSLRETDVSKVEYDSSRLVPAGERLDSVIRETKSGSPSKTNGVGAVGGKEKTLDDWLAEGEGEEEESEDEESEEESEEEESSEEASEAEEEQSSDDDKEHDRLVK